MDQDVNVILKDVPEIEDFSSNIPTDITELIKNNYPEESSNITLEKINQRLEVSTKKISDEETEKRILEICRMVCQKCNYKFKSYKELKSHYRKEHQIEGFVVCCDKKIYTKARIFDHVNRHFCPSMFHCKECNRDFKDRYALSLHVSGTHVNGKYLCDLCNKNFAKLFKLRSHMACHISEEGKLFKCNHCDRKYSTKNRLEHHNRITHDKSPIFICEICSKILKSKYSFEMHRREHLNTDIHVKIQCQECGHWLKNFSSYKKHIKRHKESKQDNICSYCSKNYPNINALKAHIKYVHLDERNHKCTYCDKAFKKAWNLKEHVAALHTGITLYECNFCQKTFNSSSNMAAHRKKLHPQEWKAQLMPKYLKPH